jgi:adhesin transport system outer membrane protein
MPRRFTLLVATSSAVVLQSIVAFGADPLTLKEAISRAVSYAPAAEIARAQTDLSDAKVREARAPFFPTIIGSGEYNQAPGYDQVITNRGLTLAQLGLDYTAFDGGRRDARLKASRYTADAARLGLDATRVQIIFATTVAYFDLLRQRATVAELQGSVKRLSQYVAIVENLRRSGRAVANDVLKIQSALDATQLSLSAAEQSASHAGIGLASLIGEPGHSDLAIAEVPDLTQAPSGRIEASPVYRAAQRQFDAAAMAVDAARAEAAPTVRLALTSGWEGIDPPKTFGHHLGASYDGSINVPIFQGGLVQAHIDEAKANQHAAVAQLRQIQIDLQRDLADATSRDRAARGQLALLARSQTTADDAFALDWTRFLGGGNVTLLEVLDAYRQAENLRTARFDDVFASRQATAEAALILGVEQ